MENGETAFGVSRLFCFCDYFTSLIPFVAARFYLVATIPTGSTCQNSLREAQPRTNRVAGCLY